LLLWFLRNNRPTYDQVQLVLLDVNARKILDIHRDIGETPDNLTIVRRTDGFSVSLFKEWRKDSNNGGEFGVSEWADIAVEQNRIVAAWRGGTITPKPTPLKPAAEKRGG
jgi:hypothetical protein